MKENKTLNLLFATFMLLSIANISMNLLQKKKGGCKGNCNSCAIKNKN